MRISPTVAFTLLLAVGCDDAAELEPSPNPDATVTEDPDAGAIAEADAGATDAGAVVDAGATDAGPPPAPKVVLFFGANLSSAVRERVQSLLTDVAARPVEVQSSFSPPYAQGTLLLSFGDHPVSAEVIDPVELSGLGSEGFVVRQGLVEGAPVLAADGNPLDPDPFGHANLGAGYAAYAALEGLGFAFLHPLAPTSPAALPAEAPAIERAEAPRWPIRGMQIHTMHPLELTDLLNGWSPAGPDDEAGWAAMLPEWDRYLEWMLANRQNHVQWVLLWAASWAEFADGAERRARLATLVDRAHEHGVAVGVDVPIALHQQHAFQLLRNDGALADEIAEIQSRADWLMGAGFDYLATENGSSEFTHPPDTDLVAWMDGLADHLRTAHGKPAYIKIHVSQGQFADTYTDANGDPLNINLIPHFASSNMGVMPHTVQHYALDDPAPTYGNTDFGYMRDFLQEEVGRREVVWHPESAYWVSFDVDVPLYLPVYAQRRFHDLRLLAQDEREGLMGRGPHAGGRMDGQIVFSSGWEWGYWLNDVVAARAAWDPREGIADETAALKDLLREVFASFGPARDHLVDHVVDVARMQGRLLIDGEVNGAAPSDIEMRNGQAYLQGAETWDDVSDLAGSLPLPIGPVTTQPDKLGLVDMRNPLHGGPGYSAEIEPLLGTMAVNHDLAATTLENLTSIVPAPARPLYEDLVDSARITALRAQQVHGLYDYVDGFFDLDQDPRRRRLQAARDALDAAAEIVARREAAYRVDPDRIAGWRNGPTAYEYGYLWTVRSLFFWWRDEGKAVDAPLSPCYLNIINPADVGFGEGLLVDATRIVRDVSEDIPAVGSLTECLAETRAEPTFPQDNLRTRP